VGRSGGRKETKALAVGINELAGIEQGKMDMRKRGQALLVLVALLSVAGCAPVLFGGAVAVVADEAIEQEQGTDGLF
jgi:hypothetical protein